MCHKLILFPMLLLCGLLSAFTPAHAATTGPLVTSTPVASTLTDWSSSLAFPLFNPALGNLTQVTLSLTGSFDTVLTIINSADSGSSGTVKTEIKFSANSGSLFTTPIDVLSSDFAYSLGSGGYLTSGTLHRSGTSTDIYTDPSVLSLFKGTGNRLFDASTFTQTLLANTGGVTAASQVSHAGLTGSVTYDYTPVPLPAAFLLLGPGLAGVAIVRKRCKA